MTNPVDSNDPAEGTGLPVQKGYKAWITTPDRKGQDRDFGVWWQLSDRPGNAWRVSWSQKTGEVYACSARSDRFIVFGVINDPQAVERLLDGWADASSPIYHNLVALAERFR